MYIIGLMISYEVSLKEVTHNGFIVVATPPNSKKLYGDANFFRVDATTWGSRVDVKEKTQGNQIATRLLTYGDQYIHQNFPHELRLFNDLNSFSYHLYTSLIADNQIISFDDNGLLFKP